MAPPDADDTLGSELIGPINKLQDIFAQVTVDLKLNLPQVAVIGGQSSGKSSVLEALVGRDFLPRGSDIVTRRPLVLQLIKTSPENSAEWGEFLHVPGKMFDDFAAIRDEIQAETDRVVGSNKNVSEKPIRLKIFSPHVLTMTLVDLPGMTRVPVGDQPSNIEQKIRDIVLEYIRQPTCIVLAVTPANSDLANSDALHMARLVDPEGSRTVGVLTKVDIMDRGTNCAHILRNAHIPLRMGYVGVVLRSQQDINTGTSMADARRYESSFFSAHAEYSDVAAQCGVSFLARRLNALLVEHIRSLLPVLRRRIQDLLERRSAELSALGDASALEGKSARGAFLLQLLCDYSERLGAMLDGRHAELTTRELSGGARLRHVFIEVFGRTLKSINPIGGVSDEQISTVIKNGAGVTGNLLVPHEPFELLVRRAISLLLPPALQCKEAVHDELLRIAEAACPRDAARFPQLQRALAHAVMDFIRSGVEPAERQIRHLVACELDYINCDHPEFISGRGAIRAVIQERNVRSVQGRALAASNLAGGSASGPAAAGSGTGTPAAGRDSAQMPSNARKPPGASAGANSGDASSSGKAPPPSRVGLKGLGEHSSTPSDDIFISTGRARRRSDDGVPLGHPNGHASGSGAGAGMSGAVMPGGSGNGGSSWFSWFARGEPAQTDTLHHTASTGTLRAREAGDTPRSSGRFGGLLYTEQEEVEVEVIRKLVESYFCIVRKTMLDQVPKAVMHFMVNNTKRGMQQYLIQHLYRDDVLDELLQERPEVLLHREKCSEAVKALQEASKALEEVPGELTSLSVLGMHSQPTLLPGMNSGGKALSLHPNNLSPSGAHAELRGGSLDASDSMDHAVRVATMATYALSGSSAPVP